MNAKLYVKRGAVFEAATAKATDEQLAEINSELALGFSPQELKDIQAYFRRENRNPTDVELQTISQTWSRTLLPQNLQGQNPNRRQRNRQPLQNLHRQSHQTNQSAMVLQRV